VARSVSVIGSSASAEDKNEEPAPWLFGPPNQTCQPEQGDLLVIDVHYWPTPNGWKVSIMLEECGLPYRIVPVNIGRGEQFQPEFLAISPNNRIPAIVDH